MKGDTYMSKVIKLGQYKNIEVEAELKEKYVQK